MYMISLNLHYSLGKISIIYIPFWSHGMRLREVNLICLNSWSQTRIWRSWHRIPDLSESGIHPGFSGSLSGPSRARSTSSLSEKWGVLQISGYERRQWGGWPLRLVSVRAGPCKELACRGVFGFVKTQFSSRIFPPVQSSYHQAGWLHQQVRCLRG